MKKIIFTRPDGGLSVVHPADGARLAFSVTLADGTRYAHEEQVIAEGENSATGEQTTIVKAMPVDNVFRGWPVEGAVAEWAETEDEFAARIRAKDVPADALDVQIVEESAIPQDRTFRNAWKAGQGHVEHDMVKAREIHRTSLRALRKPKLEALDIEYQRADERGDATAKQEIAKRKQALRDAPADPRIEAAATPEELKAVLPEILK